MENERVKFCECIFDDSIDCTIVSVSALELNQCILFSSNFIFFIPKHPKILGTVTTLRPTFRAWEHFFSSRNS